ncbi:unnamed protein product [Eruca vesicaria subsp. sativa]|uniref:Peptidase A1 domain-containing protein n=1 Tax=Eruca vesicaria subsp. sativa TaxID=29727 RepID=A0ABC8IWG9_ERUVS|nr:unnamed protein product [Eruca vesicaria subsp. sativa]
MSPAIRMMSTTTLFIQIITFFLFTATVLSSSPPSGFSIDLFQRRSNSSSSRVSNTQLGSSPYADTEFENFVYLMNLQIGTPPIEIEAILDTGSEITWTNCFPCNDCIIPFSPLSSSTYKEKICDDNPCPYEINYEDKTYSRGTYATETIRLQSTSGKPYTMPETTIGCSHNSSADFKKPSPSGVVGLNWGPLSLLSQMGEDMLGLMSYCFSGKGTSKLNFGSNAIVSGDGTVSANLFRKLEHPNNYYLNLDAVSVGKTRIETLGTPLHASDGNIIIDSGTTLTYLPESYCKKVRTAVEKVVKAERVASPGYQLCYRTKNMDLFPVIKMHFQGGADLFLDKFNTYMTNGEVTCLMIVGDRLTPIFGNRAQNNFLVGYDPSSQLVSFKPTNCSALWS